MRIRLEALKSDRITVVSLPCDEESIQHVCEELKIENNMTERVKVIFVMEDERANELFKSQEVNIDELNFLSRRLKGLSENQKDIFYAVAKSNQYTSFRDLLNLTYNTHCYSLINDFRNTEEVAKSIYLNEKKGEEEENSSFSAVAHMEELIKNGEPEITTHGIIYRNRNIIEEVYDGYAYPKDEYVEGLIELLVGDYANQEILPLPVLDSQIKKLMERVEISSIDELMYSFEKAQMPENLLNFIMDTYEDIEGINEICHKLKAISKSDTECLSNLTEEIKVSSKEEFETLIEALHEFEMFKGVHSPKDYGRYMIIESGHFEYDHNLEEYIDFERYGREKVARERGCFTDKGYLNYLGYNEKMIGILNKNLRMNLEYEPYEQTIKLYMPLKVTTYYEEDDYGRYQISDYEGTLSSQELCGYEDELNEFLDKYQGEVKKGRSLMEYYGKADTINAKVQSYHFEFEQMDGDMYGVVLANLNAPLTKKELEVFCLVCEGQAADGLGEGLEQREFSHRGRDIHIHLWDNGKDWYIKTAEEMGFKEKSQGFEMKMI